MTKKFALISHVLPPSQSGQSMMLYRLLRRIDADDYCLVRPFAAGYVNKRGDYSERLPAEQFDLAPERQFQRGYRWGLLKLRKFANRWMALVIRAWRIARVARRTGSRQIVACTGDLLGPPAACLASYLAGAEFYLYMFDYYSYEWTDPEDRAFATRMEAKIARRATSIIATNEVLAEELRARYGSDVKIIHNACDLTETAANSQPQAESGDTETISISYTGAIYEAQRDALLNLVAALESLGDSRVELHIYSRMELFQPGTEPVKARVLFHDHQSLTASRQIQQQSDILFLPLGFHTKYPELVRTSAPAKMAEYLASGRPILVHAPADTFIARYCREHDCALVVDQPEPTLLAEAVQKLIADAQLRRQLAERAWQRAQSDFNEANASATLAALLQVRLLGEQ